MCGKKAHNLFKTKARGKEVCDLSILNQVRNKKVGKNLSLEVRGTTFRVCSDGVVWSGVG